MRTPWWLFFACLLVAAGCSDSEHPTAVQVSSLDQAAVPAAVPPAAGVQGEFWPAESPPLLPAECFYDPANELEGYGLPVISVADFREQQVIRNAWIVKAAVEAWSAESGGQYPACTGDASPLGNTIFDFIPGRCMLTNPYTRCCDSPCNGAAAVHGQVGYQIWDVSGSGMLDGYRIDGLGKHDQLICLLIGP